ncbi:MAG: MBOAT family protein [Spirochaetes bacterium]|nr:MBOAT family protein [Spirochaetota bacterium]
MNFTSIHFLCLFLPLVLAVYCIAGRRLRTPWLLLAGLAFYAWAEGWLALVIAGSVLANWLFVLRLSKDDASKTALAAAVALNLGALLYFGYGDAIAAAMGIAGPGTAAHRPLGISFFTLTAISFVVEARRGERRGATAFSGVAMAISFFPRLAAGPIVRPADRDAWTGGGSLSRESLALGASRFIVGLAKKVLVADTVGAAADRIFALPAGHLTVPLAWTGALCFALQFYFAFSGLSDMAIGLGRIFGFTLPENFRYPFAALSVRDHWRRWHITLVDWMRDYLYKPMAGDAGSLPRRGLAVLLAFAAVGLWHGAGWHLLLWGLWNGLFVALEQAGAIPVERLPFRPLRWLYTALVVLAGYVLFRAGSLEHAGAVLAAMAGHAGGDGAEYHIIYYVQMDTILAFLFGVMGAAPLLPWIDGRLRGLLGADGGGETVPFVVYRTVKALILAGLLALSIIRAAAVNGVPFLFM